MNLHDIYRWIMLDVDDDDEQAHSCVGRLFFIQTMSIAAPSESSEIYFKAARAAFFKVELNLFVSQTQETLEEHSGR
jgi:hypothetical protein